MVRTEAGCSLSALSEPERRVAALAADGYTNWEIALALFITMSTVEQHLTRIYRKIKVRTRAELRMPMTPRAGRVRVTLCSPIFDARRTSWITKPS